MEGYEVYTESDLGVDRYFEILTYLEEMKQAITTSFSLINFTLGLMLAMMFVLIFAKVWGNR